MEALLFRPEVALAIVTALLQLGALYGVLRSSLAGLEKDREEDRRAQQTGQAETQRLVKALHSRFDALAADVGAMKVKHARLDERIKYTERDLRDTQRLRLQRARAEAQRAGQPPMLAEDSGDEG